MTDNLFLISASGKNEASVEHKMRFSQNYVEVISLIFRVMNFSKKLFCILLSSVTDYMDQIIFGCSPIDIPKFGMSLL